MAPNERGSLPKRQIAAAVAQNPVPSRGLGARDWLNRLAGGEEAVRSAFVGRGGCAHGRGRRGAQRLLEPKWEGGGEGMGGGVGSGPVSRGRREMGEREGPMHVGWHHEVKKRGQQQPPAIGRGRRRCHLIGEGDGAWATWRDTTDKRGRVSRGPGVSGRVREGERRARQCGGGALTCGPGQHSAGRRDSKLSLNRTKIQTGPN
jgi:hypothetical protein